MNDSPGLGPANPASEDMEVWTDENGNTLIKVTCGNIVGNFYLKKFSESTLYMYSGIAEMCAAQRYAGYLPMNVKHLGVKTSQ